jgi:hypothetical protein
MHPALTPLPRREEMGAVPLREPGLGPTPSSRKSIGIGRWRPTTRPNRLSCNAESASSNTTPSILRRTGGRSSDTTTLSSRRSKTAACSCGVILPRRVAAASAQSLRSRRSLWMIPTVNPSSEKWRKRRAQPASGSERSRLASLQVELACS